MTMHGQPVIRAARRGDVPALVDLRIQHLGEIAKQATHVRLLPDARQRTEQTMPVWLGQQGRLVLVAELGSDEEEGESVVVGYAMGLVSTWPPLFKNQKVGEVLECYVAAAHRGHGTGRQLIHKLTEILVGRDVEVLRAIVPEGVDVAHARMVAEGYEPLYVVMRRDLDEF